LKIDYWRLPALLNENPIQPGSIEKRLKSQRI